jgi:D-alanyl-D-alanine carboxypeptidase
MAPSKLGLEVGEEIAVIDAIKALVVKSANDIAVAVAERIGGTEYQFAQMMTERARQIGMRNTTFRNASGLPNPGQFSTARDMVTLGIRLQDDFPQHYRLFSIASFEHAGKVYKSHNTLMRGFPGMDGIKTGYTRASGFNLVSSVRADGKHVVGAVFGGTTAATRNAHMRSLLYVALQKASTEKTRDSSSKLIASARKPAKPAPVLAAAAPAPAKPKPVAREKVAAAQPVAAVPPPVRAARPKADAIAGVLSAEVQAAPSQAPVRVVRLPEPGVAAEPAESPRLDLQALREAMSDAETEDTSTIAAIEHDAPEPTRPMQASARSSQDIAALIRRTLVDDAVANDQRTAATTGSVARPASTLGAQASALGARDIARGQSQEEGSAHAALVAAHETVTVPARPSAGGGSGFEVQIGAFSTANEAQSKIDGVRTRAVTLLDGHNGVTLPFQKDNRQIYRARFVNFDEAKASATCLELRRLAVDCLVVRAE